MKHALLSPDELRELVANAVASVLTEKTAEVRRPALLTRDELAMELRISASTLRTLRREGMPEVRVSDSPRFELNAVMEWLRARQKGKHR